MRQILQTIAFSLLPALAFTLVVPGCGKKDDAPPKGAGTSAEKKTEGTSEKKETVTETKKDGGADSKKEVTAKLDAVVTGKVVIDGPKPEPKKVPAMADHGDKKVCLCDEAKKAQADIDQTWIVDDKGGVANVLVILQPTGKVAIPADVDAELKKVQPVLDQPFCAFEPHVVALYKGQKLLVKNSATVPHNTKIVGDALAGNATKDQTLPPGKSTEPLDIKFQKNPLNVSCSFHTWMSAKIVTLDHPFFAVTKADGTFEVKNVPSGVELTAYLWHESAKERLKQSAFTFKTGNNSADFKISAK